MLNDITHEFNSSISSITNIDNGDDNDSNSDNTGSNKDNKDSNDETIESTDDTDDTDDIDNTDDSKTTNTDERDGNSDPAYKLFVPCGACGVSYRSTAFLDPNNRCNEVLCPRLLCDSCSRGPPYSCPVPTCLKAYCDRHFQQLRRIDTIRRCSLCDDPICGEHNHLDVCDICYRVFCLQCRVDLQRMHCRSCGNMYCGKCTGVQIMCAVPSCGKSYCRQCAESRIDASCMGTWQTFGSNWAIVHVYI